MTEQYDVFVSYSRADSARAELIRERLEALNLSVFFDAEGIDVGAEFPVVIDQAVKSAKCVLGLWSRSALQRRWVRIESRIGLDQQKLVAAVLDDTKPEDLPAEFYNVNVEDLSDFDGQGAHDGWARIVRAIGRRTGRADLAGAPPPRAPRPAQAAAPAAKKSNAPMLILAGVAALGLLAFGAFQMIGRPQAPPSAAIEAPAEAVEEVALDQADAARPSTTAQSALEAESARLWGNCEAGRAAACRAYIADFPGGPYAEQARAKLSDLNRPVAPDISGTWSGYYAQGANRTPFSVEINGDPGAFRGRMAERADFGDGAPRLYADIAGRTNTDGVVTFVKTYDGTGGVSHSVQYEGRITDGGGTISGTWRLTGASGSFRMSRE